MVPRQLSGVQSPTHSSGSPVNCLSAFQRHLLLSSFFPANSHSRPLPTSGYGEISGPRILCLVSRQNKQRNRLLWQPTHIVLHTPLLPLSFIHHKLQHNSTTSKKTRTFTGSNTRNYKILKGFGRPLKKNNKWYNNIGKLPWGGWDHSPLTISSYT